MIARIARLLFCGLLLAACSGPAAPPAASTSAPAALTSSPTNAPATTRPGLTRPAATVPQPAAATPSATPAAQCSRLPLGESILVLGGYTPAYPNDPRNLLTATDPANGLPACGYASFSFLRPMGPVFSPDHTRLALFEYLDENLEQGVLHLVDLAAWQAVTTTVKIDGPLQMMAFNPAGTQLAISFVGPLTATNPADTLWTVDLANQKVVAQKELGFSPRLLRYTPDGRRLIVFGGTYGAPFGSKPPAIAALLDAQDLKAVWQPALPGVWSGTAQPESSKNDYIFNSWDPAATLAPDGETLYVVHSDEERLTQIDFARRRVVTRPIQPERTWLERLLGVEVAYAKGQNGVVKQAVFSKDGKRLFVSSMVYKTEIDAQGNWQFSQTPLGLRVIDLLNGAELEKPDVQGMNILLSPDGNRLALLGWKDDASWIDLLDADSLAPLAHLDGYSISPALTLNGKTDWILTSPPSAMVRPVDPAAPPGEWPGSAAKWWMGGSVLGPQP